MIEMGDVSMDQKLKRKAVMSSSESKNTTSGCLFLFVGLIVLGFAIFLIKLGVNSQRGNQILSYVENVHNWMRQIESNAADNVTRILLGNKCDVEASKQMVTAAQGKALAAEFDIAFFETSAKKNTGVDEAFEMMAKTIVGRLKENPDHYGSEGGMSLAKGSGDRGGAKAGGKQGGCC